MKKVSPNWDLNTRPLLTNAKAPRQLSWYSVCLVSNRRSWVQIPFKRVIFSLYILSCLIYQCLLFTLFSKSFIVVLYLVGLLYGLQRSSADLTSKLQLGWRLLFTNPTTFSYISSLVYTWQRSQENNVIDVGVHIRKYGA